MTKTGPPSTAHDKFSDLLKRLVRVPKREIDEQEEQYQREREEQKRRQPTRKRA